MNEINIIRKTLAGLLLLLALPSPAAQEQADTAYTFRFAADDGMFYVPYADNGGELARLEECVASYRQGILDGEIPLYVEGHAGSHAVAKTRSNRVKSELIVRQGLKEECFVTRNHADGGDYVTVTVRVAPTGIQRDGEPGGGPHTGTAAEKGDADAPIYNKEGNAGDGEAQDAVAETQTAETAMHDAGQGLHTGRQEGATLSLRANLLRWATLTPDLGLEWRVHPSWGILVNGSWTSWSWNNKDRRYALWEVMPEVRWYMGREKRGYLGAMFKAGEFNYKLSAMGKQGDLTGGGITGGYQLRLNDALSLDFSVAVGCLHADYEKYEVVDGVRVRRGTETKNWWGPVNAGITLAWKLF